MSTDTTTEKRDPEGNTAANHEDGSKRDNSLERASAVEQRHGGENRIDVAAPKGPVNVPVKK